MIMLLRRLRPDLPAPPCRGDAHPRIDFTAESGGFGVVGSDPGISAVRPTPPLPMPSAKLLLFLLFPAISGLSDAASAGGPSSYNVADFGATGGDIHADTAAIQ